MSLASDDAWMLHALNLARRNLGQTWPNPAVGAVIIKDNHVVGVGWTARGGRPHAEPQALEMAGVDAKGATLYVTLEPCAHQGKTPPCAEAIIKAGISRMVVACRDPHRQVNGKGIGQLKAAGIAVVEGVCEKEAQRLNEGFLSVVERGRPFVAMKIATSADGCFTDPKGSRWITGEAARAHGHVLRSEYDAILTGSGTFLADKPHMNCRLPGLEDRSPQRVLLTRQAIESEGWWVMGNAIEDSLKELANRGITRLLVEAGPTLSDAFLQAGVVDRLYWYEAPGALGEGRKMSELGRVAKWEQQGTRMLGVDQLKVYEKSCSPD